MRMMVRAKVPVEAGNAAIQSGKMGTVIHDWIDRFKPEGAYFMSEHGERCSVFFVDLEGTWQIPLMAEPLFNELNASVEFIPVMNADELGRGLSQLPKP
jgi:hypothetical protein